MQLEFGRNQYRKDFIATSREWTDLLRSSSCGILVRDASYIHLEASPLIHVCVNACY